MPIAFLLADGQQFFRLVRRCLAEEGGAAQACSAGKNGNVLKKLRQYLEEHRVNGTRGTERKVGKEV